MPTILRETYPTARKEHGCEFCCEKIAIGQKYVRQTNIYDGTIYDFVTHQECDEVARELNMYDDCDDSGLDGKSFAKNWIHTYMLTIMMNTQMMFILVGGLITMRRRRKY